MGTAHEARVAGLLRALPRPTGCPSLGHAPKAYLVMSPLPPKPQQLLVLPGHEVHGRVFQQSREHEQQANGHPNVNSLHIGHLE